jgi:hypothetical protein
VGLGHGDVVALGEGMLEQQHDPGGEVADDVLEGEAEGHGGQPEAADQHPQVDPADRQGDHDAQGGRDVEGQGGDHHHDVALGVGAPQRPLHPPAHDPGHQHGQGDGEQRGQQVGQPVDEPVDEVLEGVAEGVAKALQRRAS